MKGLEQNLLKKCVPIRCTRNDVFKKDLDVIVAVTAVVFVVKAQRVKQLMLHYIQGHASSTVQRHSLTSNATAHKRVAPIDQIKHNGRIQTTHVEFSTQ